MKTISNLILLFMIFHNLYAQTEIIDSNKPISQIDFTYSNSEPRYLICTIILNPKDKGKISEVPNIDINAKIEGIITYEQPEKDPKKKIFHGVFYKSNNSSNIFTYKADIKDDNEDMLLNSRGWIKLENVKLSTTIENKYYELPSLTLYPPIVKENNTNKTNIEIYQKVAVIGERLCNIELKSNDKSQIEITDIIFVKYDKSGHEKDRTNIGLTELGEKRYATNGSIIIPVKTGFDINLNSNEFVYKCQAKGKKMGSSEIVNSEMSGVVLTDEVPLTILEDSRGKKLTFEGVNSYDHVVNTKGKGTLSMVFVSEEYKNNVIIFPQVKGSVHTFKISNIDRIKNDLNTYYYYNINGINDSELYSVEKVIPTIKNFKLDAVKDSTLGLEFSVPPYIKDDQIKINLIDVKRNKNIWISGNVALSKNTENSTYRLKLDNNLANLLSSSEIIDLILEIELLDRKVYNLAFSMYNPTNINKKIYYLIEETLKRPNRRSSSDINAKVDEIARIGRSLGNRIDDSKIQNIKDELINQRNKERINNTISDIGKWALVVGKIAIPVL